MKISSSNPATRQTNAPKTFTAEVINNKNDRKTLFTLPKSLFLGVEQNAVMGLNLFKDEMSALLQCDYFKLGEPMINSYLRKKLFWRSCQTASPK